MTSPQDPQQPQQWGPPDHLQSDPPAHHPRSGRGVRTLSLALAIVWLVASVAAGVWLFTGTKTATVQLNATMPTLTARSSHDVYGGDAYTGIQNTASDTEHAVVDGTNGLAGFSQQLADSSAEFNRRLTNRLQQGLGVLIIGVGLVNFTIALSRATASE